jgi:hypothetical protein
MVGTTRTTQEVTPVARIGVFGRRAEEQDRPTAVGSTSTPDRTEIVDRDRDGVDDREERLVKQGELKDADTNKDGVVDDAEARAAHERTQARLANRERLAAGDRADERVAGRTAVVDRSPVIDRDRDGVDDRVQTRPAPAPKIRARASLMATFALIVGLTSVYCALTGRLAPVAVPLGVIGLLLSFVGLSATGRPRVAGSGMAVLALLLSVGGAVLGVLAMNDSATWLDSDVDQVARLRDWLDTQFTFMRDW